MAHASDRRLGRRGSQGKPQRVRTARRLLLEQLENRLAMDASFGPVDFDVAHATHDGFELPAGLAEGTPLNLDLVSNDFFSSSYPSERKITDVKVGVGFSMGFNYATGEPSYQPWSGTATISDDGKSVTLSGDLSQRFFHIYYTVDGAFSGQGSFYTVLNYPVTQFDVPQNGAVQELDVLANQNPLSSRIDGVWHPGGGFEYAITSVEQPPEGYGQVAISEDGKKLLYTPPANPYAAVNAITFNYTLNSGQVQTAVVRLQFTDASTLLPPETLASIPEGIDVQAVANVIAHAANLSGLSSDEFTIVYAERVCWRDGSLGASSSDSGARIVTLAVENGYHIIVEAGGERFDYHLGNWGRFVLAEREASSLPLVIDEEGATGDQWITPIHQHVFIPPETETSVPSIRHIDYPALPTTPVDPKAVLPPETIAAIPENIKLQDVANVAAHAAGLKGLSPSDFTIVLAAEATWGNTSMVASRPGRFGLFAGLAMVDGYQIVIEAGGEQFDYHLDDQGRFILASRTPVTSPEVGDELPGEELPSDPSNSGPGNGEPIEPQVEITPPLQEADPIDVDVPAPLPEVPAPVLNDAQLAALALALTSPSKPTESMEADESSTDSTSAPLIAAADELALALGSAYAGAGSQRLFLNE